MTDGAKWSGWRAAARQHRLRAWATSVVGMIALVGALLAAGWLFADLTASGGGGADVGLRIGVDAFALLGFLGLGLAAHYVFAEGRAGLRRVVALVTETVAGKLFGGLVCAFYAVSSAWQIVVRDDFGQRVAMVVAMIIWALLGTHELRSALSQWARQRELRQHGPYIERIPSDTWRDEGRDG